MAPSFQLHTTNKKFFQHKSTPHDAYGQMDMKSISNPLNYDGGPITRSQAKRMKDTAKELVQRSLEPMEQKGDDLEETKLINLLSCDQATTRPCVFLYSNVEHS